MKTEITNAVRTALVNGGYDASAVKKAHHRSEMERDK